MLDLAAVRHGLSLVFLSNKPRHHPPELGHVSKIDLNKFVNNENETSSKMTRLHQGHSGFAMVRLLEALYWVKGYSLNGSNVHITGDKFWKILKNPWKTYDRSFDQQTLSVFTHNAQRSPRALRDCTKNFWVNLATILRIIQNQGNKKRSTKTWEKYLDL